MEQQPVSVTVVGNPFTAGLGSAGGAPPAFVAPGPPAEGPSVVVVSTTDVTASAAGALAEARKSAAANARAHHPDFTGGAKAQLITVAVLATLGALTLLAGALTPWINFANTSFYALWYVSFCGFQSDDQAALCTVFYYDGSGVAMMGYMGMALLLLGALFSLVLMFVASVLCCKGDALSSPLGPGGACGGGCAAGSTVSTHNVLGLAWSAFTFAGAGMALGFGLVFYPPQLFRPGAWGGGVGGVGGRRAAGGWGGVRGRVVGGGWGGSAGGVMGDARARVGEGVCVRVCEALGAPVLRRPDGSCALVAFPRSCGLR